MFFFFFLGWGRALFENSSSDVKDVSQTLLVRLKTLGSPGEAGADRARSDLQTELSLEKENNIPLIVPHFAIDISFCCGVINAAWHSFVAKGQGH